MILAVPLKRLFRKKRHDKKAIVQNRRVGRLVFKNPSLILQVYSLSFQNLSLPLSLDLPLPNLELISVLNPNRSKSWMILESRNINIAVVGDEIWILNFDNISCDNTVIIRPNNFVSRPHSPKESLFHGYETDYTGDDPLFSIQMCKRNNAVFCFEDNIDIKNPSSMLMISLKVSKLIMDSTFDNSLPTVRICFDTFDRCKLDITYALSGIGECNKTLNDKAPKFQFTTDLHNTASTEVEIRACAGCGFDEIIQNLRNWKHCLEIPSLFINIRDWPIGSPIVTCWNPFNEYYMYACVENRTDRWSQKLLLYESEESTKICDSWSICSTLMRPSPIYSFQQFVETNYNISFRNCNWIETELHVSKLLSLTVPALSDFNQILKMINSGEGTYSNPNTHRAEKITFVENHHQSNQSVCAEDPDIYFEAHNFHLNVSAACGQNSQISRAIAINNDELSRNVNRVMIVSKHFVQTFSHIEQALWKSYNCICLEASFLHDVDIFCSNDEAIHIFSSSLSPQQFQEKLKMVVEGALNLKRLWLVLIRDDCVTSNNIFVQLFLTISSLPCRVIFRDCMNCADECSKVLNWISSCKRCAGDSTFVNLMEHNRFQAHCDFLQRFPGINYWDAAELLSSQPLAQLFVRPRLID
jgi:hypothetical protein